MNFLIKKMNVFPLVSDHSGAIFYHSVRPGMLWHLPTPSASSWAKLCYCIPDTWASIRSSGWPCLFYCRTAVCVILLAEALFSVLWTPLVHLCLLWTCSLQAWVKLPWRFFWFLYRERISSSCVLPMNYTFISHIFFHNCIKIIVKLPKCCP